MRCSRTLLTLLNLDQKQSTETTCYLTYVSSFRQLRNRSDDRLVQESDSNQLGCYPEFERKLNITDYDSDFTQNLNKNHSNFVYISIKFSETMYRSISQNETSKM